MKKQKTLTSLSLIIVVLFLSGLIGTASMPSQAKSHLPCKSKSAPITKVNRETKSTKLSHRKQGKKKGVTLSAHRPTTKVQHICSSRHSHHARKHNLAKTHYKPRYAYPLSLFMLKPPESDLSPLPEELSQQIHNLFLSGLANSVPASALVRAGIAVHYPMRGGIFTRREAIKYIVVHSTETGIPLNAKRVINSWSSGGRRHAGAHYVVDRDGTIHQAVDPELATVHLNIFKTLPGINNDNSIGIEMVHTGRQSYTKEQRAAVIRLVSYLQDRYKVVDDAIITHRYAQQGDHTDPVAFDWLGFLNDKNLFRKQAIAKNTSAALPSNAPYETTNLPSAATYLQINGKLSLEQPAEAKGLLTEETTLTPKEQHLLPEPSEQTNRSDNLTADFDENTHQPQTEAATSTQLSNHLVPSVPVSNLELKGPIEVDPQIALILSESQSATMPTANERTTNPNSHLSKHTQKPVAYSQPLKRGSGSNKIDSPRKRTQFGQKIKLSTHKQPNTKHKVARKRYHDQLAIAHTQASHYQAKGRNKKRSTGR